MTKTLKTAKALHLCECAKFEAHVEGSDVTFTTGCNAQTVRTFAPGHDAKLKSALITWAILGYEIRKGDATRSAEGWGDDYSFGYMIRGGIVRAEARIARRAEKAVAKANKKNKVAPKAVSAKIGRWVYEGTLDHATGEFTFTNKKGVTITTLNFRLV